MISYLMGGFRAGLSLTGSKVEGGEGSVVHICESSEEDIWVMDIVSEVSVSLRGKCENLFGSDMLLYLYDLGLVEGLWSGLSLNGSYM